MASGRINNINRGTLLRYIEGTNTGTTGNTTIQFPSVNNATYLMYVGHRVYTILVQTSTVAEFKQVTDSTSVAATSLGSYKFTFSLGYNNRTPIVINAYGN